MSDAPEDDEVDAIGFDLSDLDDGTLDELDDLLAEAGIARDWEDAVTLVVEESDADRVDALLRELEFPDELPIEDDAGDELSGVLSAWFVGADSLVRDPLKPSPLAELRASLDVAAGRAAPFGVDPELWSGCRDDVARLVDLVVTESAPDEIIELASSVRARLRPIV